MRIFNQKKLRQVGTLEQDLAMGETENHEPLKNVMGTLTSLLTEPTLSTEDRLRLLMLYSIHKQGMSEADRKRVLEFAKIPPREAAAIANLTLLGVKLSKDRKGEFVDRQSRPAKSNDEVPYALSRFSSMIKTRTSELIINSLDPSQFPTVREHVIQDSSKQQSSLSMRRFAIVCLVFRRLIFLSTKAAWQGKGKSSAQRDRYVVYVLGGITYSEMRSVYDLAQQHDVDVYLGSTSILTPTTFVQNVIDLK